MIRLLVEPFRLPYMQRALLEIVVLSVLAGVMSAHVLLRRLAFFGDAITHTIFPGIAIAFVVGGSLLVGAVVAGLASAVVITVAARRRHVQTDAALAVVIGGFFAVGVLVVSSRHSYTSDLTALLFGRILTVDTRQIVETVVVAVVVLGAMALAHKELVFSAFDPVGAEAAGYRTLWLDALVNVAVAMVVVAAARAVGTVLEVALLVIPAATARLVTRSVGSLVAVSVAVSVVCGYVGLVASYEASVHHGVRLGSGATIVVALTLAFATTASVRAIATRATRGRTRGDRVVAVAR